MEKENIWILIADGARARVVGAEGHDGKICLTEKLELSAEHGPNRDLSGDKPARVFESQKSSAGTLRHAVEPKTDRHRELKREFAKEIADVMQSRLDLHQFDKLVVVAAPVTLGDLRRALSSAVKSTVIAEVSKDLTKVPNDELARHIDDLVPH